MSIVLSIFDVSIKEKRFYGSLDFELLPQQMSQIKKNTWTLASMQISTSRSRWRHYLERLWYLESKVCNMGCKIVSVRHHNKKLQSI